MRESSAKSRRRDSGRDKTRDPEVSTHLGTTGETGSRQTISSFLWMSQGSPDSPVDVRSPPRPDLDPKTPSTGVPGTTGGARAVRGRSTG